MTVKVRIEVTGTVSNMAQAEQSVEAIRAKAKQSSIKWYVKATYEE